MNIKSIPREALEKLCSNGYEAYLVGGCVRDYAMGIEPYDYDICTNALPTEILSVFSEYKTIETGIKHGTVTVIINNSPIEITTYRSDGKYTAHRTPEQVAFVSDLKSDLSRRDFTVNSICCDKDGRIIDTFGGMADIERKVIRAIGNPYTRFEEDALRILRAIRFASVLQFSIEENTEKALFDKAPLLDFVSAERKLTELKKLLLGKNVTEVLLRYREIIARIVPEVSRTFDFEQNSLHHCFDVWEHICRSVGSIEPDVVLRFTMLFHDTGKPDCKTVGKNGRFHFNGHMLKSAELARVSLSRLKCDNETSGLVCELIKQHDNRIKSDAYSVRKFISQHGWEFFDRYLKIRRADISAQSDYLRKEKLCDIGQIEAVARKIRQNGDCIFLNQLKVNGDDLVVLGLQGKAIGKCLLDTLDAVMRDEVINKREELISYIKERIGDYEAQSS